MASPEIPINPDFSLADVWLCTDAEGRVRWVGLPEGHYQANYNDGRAYFNNFKSTHPRLQEPLGDSGKCLFHYSGEGNAEIDAVWPY